MAVLKYKDEDGVWQELPVGGDTEIVGTDGIEVTKGDDGKVTVSGKNFLKTIVSNRYYSVYTRLGAGASGKDSVVAGTSVPTKQSNGSIPTYYSDATFTAVLRTGIPKTNLDAANKQYVDELVSDNISMVEEELTRYHHYVRMEVLTAPTKTGTAYFYYDFYNNSPEGVSIISVSGEDGYIEFNLSGFPDIPDDRLVQMVILTNGHYSTISAIAYKSGSGSGDELKIIAHGAIYGDLVTDGISYLEINGEKVTNMEDTVVQE